MAEERGALTPDDVRKVARLAKLALADDEIEAQRHRLGAVLGYAQRLQALDLEGVEPMARIGDHPAALRNDTPGATLAVEMVLKLAPDVHPPFIKAPKTLGDGGGA